MSEDPLPKTLPHFFWYFLKKQWLRLVFIQIFSFAWSIDHTLWPYIIMKFINGITDFEGPREQVWSVLAQPIGMALILWITVEFFFRMAGILLVKFLPKYEADVRASMFDYVLHHSQHYFSNRMAGEIANKIADMPQSMTRLITQVVQVFLPVFLALVIATVLFLYVNVTFAGLLVTWFVVHVGICLFFAGKCSHLTKIHSRSRSRIMGRVVDALTNHTNIRLFSRYTYENSYLAVFQNDERIKHENALWMVEKMKFWMGLGTLAGPVLGMNGYMLYLWQQHQLDVGEVVFIFNTMWNIMMMAWVAALELPDLYREVGICKQALSVIEDKHEITDGANADQLHVKKGEIKFEDVSFRYKDSTHQDLFQNKSLVIKSGEKVGLVGLSGSGKTTFVNLILRYFEVDRGKILIDNQDISLVSQESLRENISMIPQDPTLFHRTIMENIRYGRLDATDEEVIAASIKARCHDFILKQPDQYQTMVGERGLKLSGGQRQRIAIARAILKDAPVLILDEATSALDSVTEREIQEALHALVKDQTVIVIAHRLSTLSDMDRILVFSKGKIVEDGKPDALLKQNGEYAFLWKMQVGGFIQDQ